MNRRVDGITIGARASRPVTIGRVLSSKIIVLDEISYRPVQFLDLVEPVLGGLVHVAIAERRLFVSFNPPQYVTCPFQNVVRVLFVAGQMTDAEMVRELKEKLGADAPNPLERISNQSTLVERVEHTAGRREHLVEYRGPYQIQPAFRRALGELMGLEE